MVTFRISDMTCGHCASTIARAIASVDKGARIEVDIPRKLVSVTSASDEGELAEAIQEAGYTPQRLESATATPAPSGRGCGCGCGPGAVPPVYVAQAAESAKGSCCG
jgi:copper chaperone